MNRELAWMKEIEIMQLLNHPNIISVADTFESRKHIYIVMELCVGGELLECIEAEMWCGFVVIV